MNEKTAEEKLEELKAYLQSLGSAAVAFSNGVDSTFLLKVAHDVLGENVIAVTVRSVLFPDRELEETEQFCRKEGIRQVMTELDPFSIEAFAFNPRNRCYLCKKELLGKIQQAAEEAQMAYVVEGSNADDSWDYRPGLVAIAELGIKSPLRQAKLCKEEIRYLSKGLGLATWKKPSFACLASRFVYGEEICSEKLSMVEKAERLLLDQGFSNVRVRIHGLMARIELLPEEFPKMMEGELRQKVIEELKAYGFSYVTLDLMGYRTGSMNEGFWKREE